MNARTINQRTIYQRTIYQRTRDELWPLHHTQCRNTWLDLIAWLSLNAGNETKNWVLRAEMPIILNEEMKRWTRGLFFMPAQPWSQMLVFQLVNQHLWAKSLALSSLQGALSRYIALSRQTLIGDWLSNLLVSPYTAILARHQIPIDGTKLCHPAAVDRSIYSTAPSSKVVWYL